MRLLPLTLPLLLLSLCVSSAHATSLPVGTYSLSAKTTTTGVHQSVDQGTLSGSLFFDANSSLGSASLIFNDVTAGNSFTFTNVGPFTIDTVHGFEYGTIANAIDPGTYYAFSIRLFANPGGVFTLNCGVDCDTDVVINNGTAGGLNEELLGSITPVTPEPSSFVLLGTGALAALAAAKRRLRRT